MPNKSLGQHWLKDRLILEAITDSIPISPEDTILEIGPGLGTLTSTLLQRAKEVIAIEYDAELARKLPGQFPGKNLQVLQADFLTYDLAGLPSGYKVVANVPYYITTKIITHLVETGNMGQCLVLLMQQEVAEKYAAEPGNLTANAIFLQNLYDVHLGIRVSKMYFTPPPDVESQVLICIKRDVPKIAQKNTNIFKRVVRAGFSAPRKKLRKALSGGLGISVSEADKLLSLSRIDPNVRAQDLSFEDWQALTDTVSHTSFMQSPV